MQERQKLAILLRLDLICKIKIAKKNNTTALIVNFLAAVVQAAADAAGAVTG